MLIFGLRMNAGVALKSIAINETQIKNIESMIVEGLLVQENGFLKATDRGRMVLDEISVRLI